MDNQTTTTAQAIDWPAFLASMREKHGCDEISTTERPATTTAPARRQIGIVELAETVQRWESFWPLPEHAKAKFAAWMPMYHRACNWSSLLRTEWDRVVEAAPSAFRWFPYPCELIELAKRVKETRMP